MFKENANIFSNVNKSLLDYNTSFIYLTEDLSPVNYYSATAIQDLPGNEHLVNFGPLIADRLYLMSAILENVIVDGLRVVSSIESVSVDTLRIISSVQSIMVDTLREVLISEDRNIDYVNLITSEHAGRVKFISWLKLLLEKMDGTVQLLEIFNSYFDIETASGVMLDVLGDIVGVKRLMNFEPSNNLSPILSDENFRLLIKAKIAKNQWDGTIQKIYELWSSLFKTKTLILNDNQDMSVYVLVFGFIAGIQQDLVANGYIVPKPQGVKFYYAFLQGPVFSYGMDNEIFKGYSEGSWIDFV